MKVVKTSMAERNLYKFRRAMQSKIDMFSSTNPTVQGKAIAKIIQTDPQTMLLEQKYFKAVNPDAYNLITDKAKAKEFLQECREKHGNSVTGVVKAFWDNPDMVVMRFAQDEVIGKDTKGMQNHVAKLFRAFMVEHKKLS